MAQVSALRMIPIRILAGQRTTGSRTRVRSPTNRKKKNTLAKPLRRTL